MSENVVRPAIEIGGAFALTDHDGNAITEASWPGQFLLIFFGFSHCKVVCPRALAKLEAMLDSLGEMSRQIRPLYITVDPERDTPERLRMFLSDYPSFLGLTGSDEQVRDVKERFRVYAQRQAAPDGYDVPHSAITYFVAPDGSLAAHFVDALAAPEIAARIRAILT